MKYVLVFSFLFFSLVGGATEITREQVLATGLPLVEIETTNGELPTYDVAEKPAGMWGMSIMNATKVPGRLMIRDKGGVLYDSGEYVEDVSGMTIRVRGNTSALDSEKKPYKIKLQKKADLLLRGDDGTYKDKNWLLIKDKELRTCIGLWMNELMNMPWSPSARYVNVMLNGEYRGLYMLAESVRRNERCRVDISERGFLFEYDAYWWKEDVYIPSQLLSNMQYTLKYPDVEDVTPEQLSYLTSLLGAVEASLNRGWEEYLDTESFATWLLAQDIMGNWDGGGSNYYLSKNDDGNSKIKIGPLWDFDRILEMKDAWSKNHIRFYYDVWISRKDTAFLRAYYEKWEEVHSLLFEDMINRLETLESGEEAQALDASIALDNAKWGSTNPPLSEAVFIASSWFRRRETWLTQNIPSLLPTGIEHMEETLEDNKSFDAFDLRGIKANVRTSSSGHRNSLFIKGKRIVIGNRL